MAIPCAWTSTQLRFPDLATKPPIKAGLGRRVLLSCRQAENGTKTERRTARMAEIPSPLGGVHRVVIAQADMGNNNAAIRASLLLTHYPGVSSVVMCGIAGGISSPGKAEDHVRLGDIVVSNQKGVVQYDFVKRTVKKNRTDVAEETRCSPGPPSALLVEAVRILEANAMLGQRPWEKFLQEGLTRLVWARPDESTDVLVDPRDGQDGAGAPGAGDENVGTAARLPRARRLCQHAAERRGET